jgi:TRAP-type C4-dicarboxylate transport system permease small subunit
MITSPIVHPGRQGAAKRTMFGYVTTRHQRLDRLQNATSAICGVIAGAAVVAIVILTIAEVVARVVFNAPLGWSVGFIEMYLLTVSAFFGIVTAYRSGAHIAVVSLFNKVPPRGRKVLLIFSYLVVITGLAALTWAGAAATVHALETNSGPVPGSSELLIPGWIMQAIVPVSGGLGLVVVGIDLARELVSPWDQPYTDYEPGDDAADVAIAEAQAAIGMHPLAEETARREDPEKKDDKAGVNK